MCLLGSSGALRGTNGVSAEIVLTLGCEICYRLQPGTQTTSTRDKKMLAMSLLEPYRDIWVMIWADSMGLSDSEFLLLDYIKNFGPLTGFSACLVIEHLD